MKKKKIAILLSGNIRIHEENRKCLIDFFRDFEITIFATIWNNQKNINEFVKYYVETRIKVYGLTLFGENEEK